MGIFGSLFGSKKKEFDVKDLAELLMQNISSKEMAMAFNHKLLCESTIGGVPVSETPDFIKEFTLRCADGFTQFDDDRYEKALMKNLSRDENKKSKFDAPLEIPFEAFRSIRRDITDEYHRRNLSFLIMNEIIIKWDLLS